MVCFSREDVYNRMLIFLNISRLFKIFFKKWSFNKTIEETVCRKTFSKKKKKQVSEKSSAKKRSVAKPRTMEVKFSKKVSPPPKKSIPKSPKSEPRKKDDKSGKGSSGRKKKDEPTRKSIPKELASKESIGNLH